MVKQRNKIVSRVVRDMCREIVTEIGGEFDEHNQPRVVQAQAPVAADGSLDLLEVDVQREQSHRHTTNPPEERVIDEEPVSE